MPFDTHAMIGFFLLCCLFDWLPAGVLWVLYRKVRARRKATGRRQIPLV